MSQKIHDLPEEALEKEHAELDRQVQALKAQQRAISKELGFRSMAKQRAKALDGMSAADAARLLQMVSVKGVPSAEAIGGQSKERE